MIANLNKEEKDGFIHHNGEINKDLYNQIKQYEDHVDITLTLTSVGGQFEDAFKICDLIKKRTGKFKIIVSDYARSSAIILCLAANEFSINNNALMSVINQVFWIRSNKYFVKFELKDIIS